jgi:hypothetical protein
MSEAVADWISSQPIDLRGRKKVLLAAGVLSRTGDAARHLGGFARYLQRNRGFVQGDFLEVTYRGQLSGDDWTPIPYQAMDSEAPLSESTAQVVRQLRWYDARLPTDLELHMVGYSLGGVVLFRVVVGLLLEDRVRWSERLSSLITLSSPHFGCDLGIEGDLLGLFGFSALLPAGAVGRELCALGSDPNHRARVKRDAELLRADGVELLTLADENDVVVTPEDAVIAPPPERSRYVLSSPRASLGGARADAIFGHGPLLDNSKAWTLMADVIGGQEPRLRTPSGAIPL